MSKATVFTVYNSKGGVGKTTTSLKLAQNFAQMGQRVLAVDMDPLASLTKIVKPEGNGQPNPQHIGHVLGGAAGVTASLRSAARMTAYNFEIVPSGLSLELANVAAGLVQQAPTAIGGSHLYALARAIEKEGHRWDAIVIDCPGDADVLSLNGLAAADVCVVPCNPEELAIAELAKVQQLIAKFEQARGRAMGLELVVTRVDTRTNQHRRGVDALLERGAVVCIPDRKGEGAEAQLLEAYNPLAERLLAASGVDDGA